MREKLQRTKFHGCINVGLKREMGQMWVLQVSLWVAGGFDDTHTRTHMHSHSLSACCLLGAGLSH